MICMWISKKRRGHCWNYLWVCGQPRLISRTFSPTYSIVGLMFISPLESLGFRWRYVTVNQNDGPEFSCNHRSSISCWPAHCPSADGLQSVTSPSLQPMKECIWQQPFQHLEILSMQWRMQVSQTLWRPLFHSMQIFLMAPQSLQKPGLRSSTLNKLDPCCRFLTAPVRHLAWICTHSSASTNLLISLSAMPSSKDLPPQ